MDRVNARYFSLVIFILILYVLFLLLPLTDLRATADAVSFVSTAHSDKSTFLNSRPTIRNPLPTIIISPHPPLHSPNHLTINLVQSSPLSEIPSFVPLNLRLFSSISRHSCYTDRFSCSIESLVVYFQFPLISLFFDCKRITTLLFPFHSSFVGPPLESKARESQIRQTRLRCEHS